MLRIGAPNTLSLCSKVSSLPRSGVPTSCRNATLNTNQLPLLPLLPTPGTLTPSLLLPPPTPLPYRDLPLSLPHSTTMASLPLWHPVGNHFSFLWLSSSSSSLLLLSAQLEALPRHFVPYLQSRYSSDKRKQEELAVTREHLRRLHDVVDVVLPNLFTANYFRKFHHPDFYDKANVLLEYRGFGRDIKARGFHWLVLHKYFIRKYHVISFAWCKVSIISVKEIVQERLLDVTIRRHTLKKKIPSSSGSSGETNEAECMQKARWDEYRFVFHITRSGLVDHVKITQLNPPDRNQQWLKMPSLLERLLQRRAQAVP